LIRAEKLLSNETEKLKKGVSILKYTMIQEVREDKEPNVEEMNNYTLIDLRAYTVLPGLIDAHTHLLYREELRPGNNHPSLDLDKVLTKDVDAYRAICGAARAVFG
jgi:imidazolonepropionase-like amidohydrolase